MLNINTDARNNELKLYGTIVRYRYFSCIGHIETGAFTTSVSITSEISSLARIAQRRRLKIKKDTFFDCR